MDSENQIRSYRDLVVWQKSMKLVAECYSMTKEFPNHQQFGLTSQLQRAAVSIPANIAEGHGRRTTGDYLRHLAIARGSLMELETHIQIAEMLKYVDSKGSEQLLVRTAEISRMLTSLLSSLGTIKQRKPKSDDERNSGTLNPKS